MDYTFNNMQVYVESVRNYRERQRCRLQVYMILLQTIIFRHSIKENNTIFDKEGCLAVFWNRESDWEQKIYGKMKKWETRHPITGIVLCTILGGILISLVAGIILEGIMLAI